MSQPEFTASTLPSDARPFAGQYVTFINAAGVRSTLFGDGSATWASVGGGGSLAPAIASALAPINFRAPNNASLTPDVVFPKFAAAASLARAGGRCIVATMSDSTGCGFDGSYANKKRQNRSFVMAGMVRAAGFEPNTDAFMGTNVVETANAGAVTIAGYDARLALSGSMATINLNSLGGTAFWLAAGQTGSLTFTPSGVYDIIEFYYATDTTASAGSVTISNGGAALGDFASNVTASLAKQVISVAPSSAPIVITRGATAGQIFPVGCILRNSQKAQITFVNISWNGGKISDFLVNTKAYHYPTAIGVLAPDLTDFCMQINDWRAQTALATYIAGTQSIINTLKATGDVLLVTAIPSAAAQSPLSVQASYVQAYKDLADSNSAGLVDINAFFGSYVAAAVNGLMSDQFHSVTKGYGYIGQITGQSVANAAAAQSLI